MSEYGNLAYRISLRNQESIKLIEKKLIDLQESYYRIRKAFNNTIRKFREAQK